MREHWDKFILEWRIVGRAPWVLLALALTLVGLTHGVLASAGLWRRNFVDHCDAVFPMALALATGPLLQLDAEHHLVEFTSALPRRLVLHLRWLAIWGPFIGVAAIILIIMAGLWGPVRSGPVALATMGPAALLSGLSVWSTGYSGRLTVGYLVTVGLPGTDLVLRHLGAFALIPALQWIDCFAFRWPLTSPGWISVCWGQLGFGLFLIEYAILRSDAFYRRLA